MSREIQVLRDKNTYLTNAVMQHQRFLESLDADRRRNNLIVTGLSETDPLTDPTHKNEAGEIQPRSVTSDIDKVKMLLSKIAVSDAEVSSCDRLGESQDDQTRGRVLKVVLRNASDQKRILENSKNLKYSGDNFSKIYVKRDMHPGVRRELNRLRIAEKDEREKPENAGRNITYDHALRTLSVDGVVIDQFQPSFFR